MTRDDARALDAADPIAPLRERFILPDGIIYLDGNSLGPLPRATPAALGDITHRQWGERLIRSWNEGWIDAPMRIGAKLAPLIGAAPHEVIVGDTTSANLFKALVAALRFDPARRVVVSELGNFPTDLHIAEGAVACVPGASLRAVPRADLAAALAHRLENRDEADDEGQVGRAYVHRRHNSSDIAAELGKLYLERLTERRRAQRQRH